MANVKNPGLGGNLRKPIGSCFSGEKTKVIVDFWKFIGSEKKLQASGKIKHKNLRYRWNVGLNNSWISIVILDLGTWKIILEAPPTFPRLWPSCFMTAEVATAHLVCTNQLHQGSTRELLGCKSSLLLLGLLHTTFLFEKRPPEFPYSLPDLILLHSCLSSGSGLVLYAGSVPHSAMIHGV